MYRSQLILDLSDPSMRRALNDCNDMHRNLMKAFRELPTNTPRASQSLLYTLTTVEGKPALYVTSKDKPDWSLVKGVRPYMNKEPLCIDGLKDLLLTGRKLRFRLFASPTKKSARRDHLSTRVFLKSREEREQWLYNHAKKSGFEICYVEETERTRILGNKAGATIQYTAVVFTGILKITDSDAFWNAYCNGIGPGKAYGLGMLMIGG